MTSGDEIFTELSVCADPGLNRGPPKHASALYPVELRWPWFATGGIRTRNLPVNSDVVSPAFAKTSTSDATTILKEALLYQLSYGRFRFHPDSNQGQMHVLSAFAISPAKQTARQESESVGFELLGIPEGMLTTNVVFPAFVQKTLGTAQE